METAFLLWEPTLCAETHHRSDSENPVFTAASVFSLKAMDFKNT
jgi:hypothetical protein